MKKILLLTVVFVASLFADAKPDIQLSATPEGEVTININPDYYNNHDTSRDWIGIYKKDDSSDWENVQSWTWVKSTSYHAVHNNLRFTTISHLKDGKYDIRYFKNNTYVVSAQISIDKKTKYVEPKISLFQLYDDMLFFDATFGGDKTWVGLYRKGDSNSWGNVIEWTWTMKTADVSGMDFTHGPLVNGDYELRLFYNNSYKMEAKVAFTVEGEPVVKPEITLASQRDFGFIFRCTTSGEGNKDWVGLYKIGDSNSWDNVITWEWVDVKSNPYGKSLSIHGVPTGEYELRLFYHNSFNAEDVKRVYIEQLQ